MSSARRKTRVTIRRPAEEQRAWQAGSQVENAPTVAIPSRRFRWRFLLGSWLVLAVLGGIALGLHGWQMRRLSYAIYERAQAHERDQEWSQASDALHRYLQVRPDDAAARVRLAECYDKVATHPSQQGRVVDLYYSAVSVAPENLALRRRLGSLLLERGQYSAAAEQARLVLSAQSNDPTGLRIAAIAGYAICLQQHRRLDDVTQSALQTAVEANPTDVALHWQAAVALRAEGERLRKASLLSVADGYLDSLVAKSPKDHAAWLTRHRYRTRYGIEGAESDLRQAAQLAPGDRDVLLATAEFAIGQHQWSIAEKACEQLAGSWSRSPIVHRLWGDALLGAGKPREAAAMWNKALALQPDQSLELQLRLAALLVAEQNTVAAEPYLSQLERSLAASDPRLTPRELAQLRGTTGMLRARWHIQRREWNRAVPLLREVALAPHADRQGGEAVQRHVAAWQLLAERETMLERYDLAAECWERVVALQPTLVSARMAAAKTFAANGQMSEALKHAEFAAQRAPTSGDAKLLIAQLRLAQQARLPIVDRDWTDCKETLRQAESLLADDYRPVLVHAGLLLAEQGNSAREKVLEMLRAAAERFPDAVALHASLVLPLEQFGDAAGADRALQRWQELAPQDNDAKLRQAELSLLRNDVAGARSALVAAEAKLSGVEVHRAARLWWRLESAAKQPAEAKLAWRRLADLSPEDPFPLLLLADVALREQPKEVVAIEENLRQIEGEQGASWRYVRARRLLLESKPTSAEHAEIARLGKWLTQHRSGWPQTWVLTGAIAEQERNWDRAIEAYQQVVLLDGTQLPIYERLLRLLYQQGRYSEVDRFIAALASRGPLSSETSLIAIGSAAARQELDVALQWAEAALKSSPNDVPALLWVAHLQQVKGDTAKAERLLSEGLTRLPGDARLWGGLLALHQARGDRAAFSRTLQDCEACTEIPARVRDLLLAQGCELLGQYERAAEHYRLAGNAGPLDQNVQLRLATVQLQFDPAAAEKTLRALRAQAPDSQSARRMLAISLAAGRKQEAWPEIQELLQSASQATAGDDLRLEAMLRLQQQRPEDLVAARKLFEHLATQVQQPRLQDQQLLAMLYEQEQKIPEARKLYLAIAQQSTAPEHLANLIAFLVRQRDLEAAQVWLDKLNDKSGDSWLVWKLQAAIYHIGKQDESLSRLLVKLAEEKLPSADKRQDRSSHRLQLAGVCQDVGNLPGAEAQLKALAEEDTAHIATFARWLRSNGRGNDALSLVLNAKDNLSNSSHIMLLAEVTSSAAEGSEVVGKAEALLNDAVATSRDPEVLLSISNLRLQQQRNAEASRLLEQIVKIAPNQVIGLNNLAAIMADREGQATAALAYIDRALAAAPQPQPYLLDTRAKVLLRLDRNQEAFEQLQSTLRRWPNTDPRVYLHLAFAQDRLGDRAGAVESLTQARRRGLEVPSLTPVDRQLLTELDDRLVTVSSPDKDTVKSTP